MSTNTMHAATLGALSKSLQTLHLQLLRYQAEKVGFQGSPLQLFDRATKDAAFEWLRPLRTLIVAIDERRSEPEPLTVDENAALSARCRRLIDDASGPFRAKINDAFQNDPASVSAMGAVRGSLKTAHN